MRETPLELQKLIDHGNAVSPDSSAVSRPAAAVSVAADTAAVADDLVDHFVRSARQAGRSWADIGVALGVTRQAAQQRFATVPGVAGECRLSLPLTPPARRALRDAHGDARRLGVAAGTRHLLAALLRDPRVLAAKILRAVGVDPADVLAALERSQQMSVGAHGDAGSEPDLTRALDLAVMEASTHGHDYVGTEHLLLALLAEPSAAADALSRCGADYGAARGKAAEFLAGPQPTVPRRRLRMPSRS